jgi:hypothetical protein
MQGGRMAGRKIKDHFMSMAYINKMSKACLLVLMLLMFFTCTDGVADITTMSLNEALEKKLLSEVFDVSEGLRGAVLTEDEYFKLGFYDEAGELIIPFNYYQASDEKQIKFSTGLAPAADKNKKAGYINKRGEWIIKPQYDYANSFYNGIAYVRGEIDGKQKAGYIKPDGSYFIKQKYSLIYYFPIDDICVFVADDDKWGLCKPDGRIVVEPIYDDALSVFEGRALFQLNGKWGFVDLSGKKITEFEFNDARNFINGTAIVAKWVVGSNKSYAIINRDGQYLLPFRSDIEIRIDGMYNGLHTFEWYSEFEPWFSSPVVDGVFSARVNETSLYGLMNLKGEWIVKPEYYSLHYIGNKQFSFITQKKQKGVMSTNGEIIKQQ